MASPAATTLGANFESPGNPGWHVSDGESKSADLEVTSEKAQDGQHSLKVTSPIEGTADPLTQGTEVWIDFGRARLDGQAELGPLDLSGKTVSCWAWFPNSYKDMMGSTFTRMAVTQANSWGPKVPLTSDRLEKWIKLSIRVGKGDNTDAGFDASKVTALGVRVENYDPQRKPVNDPFFVDNCSIH